MIVVVVAALVLVAASVVAITSVFAAPATPRPNITSGPANPTNVTSANFTFRDSAPAATFECALDGGAFAACASPKSYPGPFANGAHIFGVRAHKANAKVSAPAPLSWRVDTVAPGATLTKVNGAAASFPLSTRANVTSFGGACGTAAGDSPSVYVSITGSAIQSAVVPCTTAATWSFSTAPAISAAGTYRVTAKQPDTAGNTGSSGKRTIVIDRTPPPKPTLTTTPAVSTEKTKAQFAWYDNEGGVHYQCSLDGAGLAPCSSSGIEHKNLSIGSHCFAVVALDGARNASTPTVFCWLVTTTVGFTINGGANQPLFPGASPQSLNLSISNSNNFAIKVTMLTVTIQSQTLNGTCSTSANFTVVHALLVPAVVPAHSTKLLSEVGVAASDRPQIRMLETNVNQNSCKGVTLHLNYSGSAVKA